MINIASNANLRCRVRASSTNGSALAEPEADRIARCAKLQQAGQMMFPSFRIHKASADEETRDIESKVAAYQAAHHQKINWNAKLKNMIFRVYFIEKTLYLATILDTHEPGREMTRSFLYYFSGRARVRPHAAAVLRGVPRGRQRR